MPMSNIGFDPSWRYAGIEFDDVANGHGLGAVFFTQHCPHHCKGCHNPSTWDENGGIPFTANTLEKLMQYYDSVPFASRLTISGGEPFVNLELVHYIVSEFNERFPYRYVWIYTGYTIETLLSMADETPLIKDILQMCDVIVDGPFVQAQRDVTLQFRGSSNQRIINARWTLDCGKVCEMRESRETE